MIRRHESDSSGILERLADGTDAGPVRRWVVGGALAALLAIYAVVCLVTQQALFVGGGRMGARRVRPRIVEVDGANAIAIGVFYLSCAVFVHCHWFWSSHPDYCGYAQIGKIVSVFGAVGALCFYIFYGLFLG